MKALKIIGIVIVALVVLIGVIGMAISDKASLERSIVIDAPIAKVYNEANTFNNIFEWSPWTKIDPNMTTEFSGPEYGVGAKYDWNSEDPNVGIGSQEILESREPDYVKTEMVFAIPGKFYAEFILTPEGEGTHVTWTYKGRVDGFFWKFLMLGIDSQLGPSYEQGLVDFKTYIEALPDPAPEVVEVAAEEEIIEE